MRLHTSTSYKSACVNTISVGAVPSQQPIEYSIQFLVDFNGSRSGEDNHEISAVITFAAVDIAHPEFGVIGAEDVCGVGSTVHPPVKSGLRILRDHVILADP